MWEELIEEAGRQQHCLDLLSAGWQGEYASRGGRIFCGKGCRGCCSLVVNATCADAVAIAGTLSDLQADAVREHVDRVRLLAGRSAGLKEFLRRHRQEMGFCPLLDPKGACSVYFRRPLSCRALLSTLESTWCSTDFGSLGPGEKESFLASLDRTAVAFPTHYAAFPRDTGAELENAANRRMSRTFGFYLSGNLPVLIHLFRDHSLQAACSAGREAVIDLLAATGLDNPLLVEVGQVVEK